METIKLNGRIIEETKTSDVTFSEEVIWSGRHDVIRDISYHELKGKCEGRDISITETFYAGTLPSRDLRFTLDGKEFVFNGDGTWSHRVWQS